MIHSRWVTSAHIVNSAETFGTRLATRTKWVAAKCIAAIPAESIPFFRIAVPIANAGYELYAVCVSVTDLDQLYSDLAMGDETPDVAMHGVCDPMLPDAGDDWARVVEKAGESLDQAKGAVMEPNVVSNNLRQLIHDGPIRIT